MDRPIAGCANLCPNMISTQPQVLLGMLSIVKHEIIHALGFSSGLFYHDKDGNTLTSKYADGLPLFIYQIRSDQSLSRVRLCDPMNRSTPGLPVHHQLPEFTETHVHQVSDAIRPSHPLLSPSPLAPNL